jgi:molybdopterin-guanine dinucleotide biosynthesis protein B
MKVFSIVGYSHSGKTSTAVAVIKELLKRGYTVGAVKESHHAIKTDTQGTDTDQLRGAGASLVAARGPNETHVFFDVRLPMQRLLSFFDYDYVVLEGVSDMDVPQIVTAIDTEGIEAKLNGRTIAVSGVISDSLSEYNGLPVINGMTDTAKLVNLIEEKTDDWEAARV